MKRKLWLLNLALLALACLLGWNMRRRWIETKAREQTVLQARPPAVSVPQLPPAPAVVPLLPDKYADVAQRMLFSRDRNPTVIVDPEPPKKEPPVPPFPVSHGVMIWPGVPTAIILSEKGKADQRSYHVGDKVGEFVIADITDQRLVLEWNGKTFEKLLAELDDKSAPVQTAAAAPPPRPAAEIQSSLDDTKLTTPAANGPGVQITPAARACTTTDTSPNGAVVDGYKKTVFNTPMGKACTWVKE